MSVAHTICRRHLY